MKFKLKDTIIVTSGKDKGATSEITKVDPQKHKVVVKDVNQYKRHLKPRDGFEGGIITIEKPLHTAKIALLCPACSKATRIGYKTTADGSKHRICKKCQANLDVVQKTAKPKKAKKAETKKDAKSTKKSK